MKYYLDVPNNSQYTSWQVPMNRHIKEMYNLTVLETGIGKGSEFLVNNFKTVYSFESNWSDEWYNMCTTSSISNWNTIYYDLSRNDSYLDALMKFVGSTKIDVVLIDHVCKGDLHLDVSRRGDIAAHFIQLGIDHVFVHDYPHGNYYWDVTDAAAKEHGYINVFVGHETGYFQRKK